MDGLTRASSESMRVVQIAGLQREHISWIRKEARVASSRNKTQIIRTIVLAWTRGKSDRPSSIT